MLQTPSKLLLFSLIFMDAEAAGVYFAIMLLLNDEGHNIMAMVNSISVSANNCVCFSVAICIYVCPFILSDHVFCL